MKKWFNNFILKVIIHSFLSIFIIFRFGLQIALFLWVRSRFTIQNFVWHQHWICSLSSFDLVGVQSLIPRYIHVELFWWYPTLTYTSSISVFLMSQMHFNILFNNTTALYSTGWIITMSLVLDFLNRKTWITIMNHPIWLIIIVYI